VFADTPVPRPLRALAVPGLGALVARLMLSRLGLLAMWRGAVADRRALGWRRFWASAGASSTRRASREILRASLLDLAGLYRPVQETLSSLSLPVLVAWGADDPFFPPGQPRRTASAVPGARLLMLPGCGHFVAEERPRELAGAMEELWRQCPGPS
jgi:pimeloyl-ACP methyl ester carboxylesterase